MFAMFAAAVDSVSLAKIPHSSLCLSAVLCYVCAGTTLTCEISLRTPLCYPMTSTWRFRFGFRFQKVFTYPMEMYVARHVLDISVFQTLLGKGPTTLARHSMITLGIWALTMALALSTRDLGSLLEIFGAFSATVSTSRMLSALQAIVLRRLDGSRVAVLGKGWCVCGASASVLLNSGGSFVCAGDCFVI